MQDHRTPTDKQHQAVQPPQLTAYLRDSVSRLIEQTAQRKETAKLVSQTEQSAVATNKRLETDYTVLIGNWYKAIPPASRQRRYTTEELLTQFAGRYRDRPAIRMIAAALRANGFTSKRDWTVAGRNQRYWLPPKD